MEIYYDRKFKQWCAEEKTEEYLKAAWGNTKEEAIENFKNKQ